MDIYIDVKTNTAVWCSSMVDTTIITMAHRTDYVSIMRALRTTVTEVMQVLLHIPPIDIRAREMAKGSALRF